LPDLTVTGAILRLSGESRKPVQIQHARQISARDLRAGNFILISSPLESPWMTLFDDKLNFRYRIQFNATSPATDGEFVNMRPLPGEKARYSAATTVPQFGVTYGVVARVPNLTGTGKVLLISGIKYTGFEAAGEYATSAKAAQELAKAFHVSDISEVPDFEVLLETYSIASAPRYVKVAALRRISN
jgi:hypothetical protein